VGAVPPQMGGALFIAGRVCDFSQQIVITPQFKPGLEGQGFACIYGGWIRGVAIELK
jgi:hypothetical protein